MLAEQLMQQIQHGQGEAMIISYADSNHYLAGLEDGHGLFHALKSKRGELITYNSIIEAEHALASIGVKTATVQLQTAYDEMVGQTESSSSRYTVGL